MGDEHGIRRQFHLQLYFLAGVARSRVEGRVLPDLVYLKVVWQLHIVVQEGVPGHPFNLTHIDPDPNRDLHGRSVHLEDVTFVRQPNGAMRTGRDLDQLDLLRALFLCKSGRGCVRWIKVVG